MNKNSELSIIDTHFHIYNTAELTLPWFNMLNGKLKSAYVLDDYLQAIKTHHIVKSCYVEVDVVKEQQSREATMSIELCEDTTNQVQATTIGADLNSHQFKNYIMEFAKYPCVRSIRHNFFAADPSICSNALVIKNTQFLSTVDVMCDLMITADKTLHGVELACACPDTLFVLNHCGSFPFSGTNAEQKQWQDAIIEYAKLENVICKISECGFTNLNAKWQIDDVTDIIQHCIDAFGEDRIVYGSNWPVCTMTGSIDLWLHALNKVLSNYTENYKRKLFNENATRYYL